MLDSYGAGACRHFAYKRKPTNKTHSGSTKESEVKGKWKKSVSGDIAPAQMIHTSHSHLADPDLTSYPNFPTPSLM